MQIEAKFSEAETEALRRLTEGQAAVGKRAAEVLRLPDMRRSKGAACPAVLVLQPEREPLEYVEVRALCLALYIHVSALFALADLVGVP